MQHTRWLYIFTAFSLLISSCQASKVAVNVDNPTTAGEIPVVSALLNSTSQEEDSEGVTETDECLECHSNKDQLIETAELEKPAESESKGVG
jgi:hypothetical protein